MRDTFALRAYFTILRGALLTDRRAARNGQSYLLYKNGVPNGN